MDSESGACSAIPVFQRSAHPVDQFARNRQAQSAALIARRVERLEQMLAGFRRHTRSRIVHIDREPTAVPDQVQVDGSLFWYGRQRIENQIGEHLSEMLGVHGRMCRRVVRVDANRDIPFLRLRFWQLNAAFNDWQKFLLFDVGLSCFPEGQEVAEQSI